MQIYNKSNTKIMTIENFDNIIMEANIKDIKTNESIDISISREELVNTINSWLPIHTWYTKQLLW